jgi:acetyl esterase/lipase
VDDPLVLIENGRGLRDTLRGFGAQVEWREYAVGGHWFQAPEGIDDVIEFLNRVVLGGGEAGDGGQSQAVVDSGAMEMDLS